MVRSIPPKDFITQSPGNLGTVEVATFLSLILYGVSLSQGYTYFRRSEGDRLSLKIMVCCLLCLETFHSFTAAQAIYYDTITRWQTAEPNSYPIAANVVLETLITVLVQCFFTLRIYRLSRKLPLCIACLILVSLRFIGGIALTVEDFLDVPKKPFNGTAMVEKFSWLITSALTCGSAADIFIAVAMVYYLRKFVSPTNLESTTALLNRLIRFSLQTGLLTSMTSLASIVCFQAMTNMVWFSVYIFLAKLYSNSLLVSLNTRPQKDENRRAEGPQSELIFEPRSFSGPYSVSFQVTFPAAEISEKVPPLTPPSRAVESEMV